MASINQFRQLYVATQLNDSDTYVLDKHVNSKTFFSKINSPLYTESGGVYTLVEGTSVSISGADATAKAADFATKKAAAPGGKLFTRSGASSPYTYAEEASYDGHDTLYKFEAYSTVSNTKFYIKDSASGEDPAIPNEVGEISVNKTSGIGKNGAIYFEYCGIDGKPQKSDFIEVDQIVSAKAVNFDYLNKDKLIETATFTVNTAYFNKKTVNGVNLTFNFKNMGGQYKTSGIYPFTVFIANPDITGPDSNAITAAEVAAAINETNIVDLAGNDLVSATTSGNDVIITAIPSGEYERGLNKAFYPFFTLSMGWGEGKFMSEEPTYTYAADSVANGDVAAKMEDDYLVERTNSGTIPTGFPYNTNSKAMVDSSANYACIDIHYYKSNNDDFSMKSHGTVTLLVKGGAAGYEYDAANAIIGAIYGKLHASGSANTLGDGTNSTYKIVNIL